MPDVPTQTAAASETEWDAFLAASPRGQFQQASGWGRVKSLDGWNVCRIFVDTAGVPVGGGQLLWKATRFGRIGYVSKGPVLEPENPETVRAALARVVETARTLRLRALILQPPDESNVTEAELLAHGFSRKPVSSVIWSTAMIDVSGGPAGYLPRMGRQARREARQAAKLGLTMREGRREDLPQFHALMVESSRRQGSQPNPARAEQLEILWDVFSPRVILALASIGRETPAGLLMIGHGRRLTFWKKGWNSQAAHLQANSFLMLAGLEWAYARGYATVDFAGIDPRIAQDLLAGQPLSDEQRRSRDMFNLRLGAQPRLLPPARLLVVNPVARRIVSLARQSAVFEQRVMRRLG